MGKSYTPTYRVETKDNTSFYWNRAAWNVKEHGRATNNNAEAYRVKLNESYQIGNVNEHISKAEGKLVHVSAVRIIRQSTEEVVATANAPLFEAY